jgi:hypothetical protein
MDKVQKHNSFKNILLFYVDGIQISVPRIADSVRLATEPSMSPSQSINTESLEPDIYVDRQARSHNLNDVIIQTPI